VRGTSFSINQYGEEEAHRRAIDLRIRMERKIYGEEIKINRTKQTRSDQNRDLPSQRSNSTESAIKSSSMIIQHKGEVI